MSYDTHRNEQEGRPIHIGSKAIGRQEKLEKSSGDIEEKKSDAERIAELQSILDRRTFSSTSKEYSRVYSALHYLRNREKRRRQMLEWKTKNPGRMNDYTAKWRRSNPEKQAEACRKWERRHRKQRTEYQRERANARRAIITKQRREARNVSPQTRAMWALRSRMAMFIRKKGGKKAATALALVGCSWSFFEKHIERQFERGMRWNNYGEWEIDHIIPCAAFGVLEDDQRRCFHWSNLQPMWRSENAAKGGRVIPTQPQLLLEA